MVNYLTAFAVSFAAVLTVTPVLVALARRLDFLDYPSALKIHSKPTPLLGGLAVFIGLCAALLFAFWVHGLPFNSDMLGLLISGGLVVAFGLVDDKRGLSPSYKLLGQIIAAILFLVVSQNVTILTGSNWDMLILTFWIVGLMNAVNYLDAMDGLCAGMSFISAGAFLVIAIFSQQMHGAVLALALMGGLLGFLRYNWSPAKIFLGDAGSMFNGFILACLGILFARENTSYPSLLVPIVILSYPIFDISFVTLIRLREGRKVYVGDYNNSPRRIASLGMQNTKVVLWIYLFCFLLGSLGVLLHFFLDSPTKMLIAVFVWLVLVIFGVHLQRNFVNIRERLVLILADVAMINAVFLLFFWVKFRSGLFASQWIIPLSEYLAPAIWITIFWLNLFAVFGLYEVPGDSRFKEELKGLYKAIAAGIILFLILTLDPSYLFLKSWMLLLIYALSLTAALALGRGFFSYLIRRLKFLGLSLRKAVIVGTGKQAAGLLEQLSTDPNNGYQVIGLIDEDGRDFPPDSSPPRATRVLGRIEDLDEIARERKLKDVLIAVEPDWGGSLQDIMDSVHNLELSFKISSGLGDLMRGYHTVPLRRRSLLRILPSPLRSWEWLIKRVFDGLISFALMLAFLPLWIAVALLVKLKFKASPLVKRRYLGKMGKTLELYRYQVSAGSAEGKKGKQASSVGLCGLGRLLRNSGLEKAPALINVLKGQMSLVGPEPLDPQTFQNLSNSLPLLPKRLNVKPGMVGLTKVRGRFQDYGQTAKDHLRDDLYYVENMSLLLDLRIILSRLASLFRR